MELEEGHVASDRVGSPELLIENRFIASRDGIHGELIDPARERRVPVAEIVKELMPLLTPHAERLGCRDALEEIPRLALESGAGEQLRIAEERGSLPQLIEFLADEFNAPIIGPH